MSWRFKSSLAQSRSRLVHFILTLVVSGTWEECVTLLNYNIAWLSGDEEKHDSVSLGEFIVGSLLCIRILNTVVKYAVMVIWRSLYTILGYNSPFRTCHMSSSYNLIFSLWIHHSPLLKKSHHRHLHNPAWYKIGAPTVSTILTERDLEMLRHRLPCKNAKPDVTWRLPRFIPTLGAGRQKSPLCL